MARRAKVELFEQIRREYEFGVGSIKGVALRSSTASWKLTVRRRASSATPRIASSNGFWRNARAEGGGGNDPAIRTRAQA